MRKCEQEMIKAVKSALRGENFKQPGGNTTVVVTHNNPKDMQVHLEVNLHGNKIAEVQTLGGHLVMFSCSFAGWQSVTTKSRINALARAFGFSGAGARFKNHGILVGKRLQTSNHPEVSVSSRDWFSII